MRLARRTADESGVALITARLAVMLMSALMVGMFAALATDQRSHAVDRDQTQAYAAAHAGLEKLTSDLAGLFNSDVSPSVAQINALTANPPTPLQEVAQDIEKWLADVDEPVDLMIAEFAKKLASVRKAESGDAASL